jgi:hypothetical protein
LIDGKVHHFGAVGFVNGLAVISDSETRSLWDHITGEAFDGPLAGEQLDFWPIRMTTVGTALSELTDIEIYFSTYFSWVWWISQRVYGRFIHRRWLWMPLIFYFSMNRRIDSRLSGQTQGLGVIVGKRARFYPMQGIKDGIEDDWFGRTLLIQKHDLDHVPFAMWKDSGEQPLQLLTRWYGFSFTYPNCEIWE